MAQQERREVDPVAKGRVAQPAGAWRVGAIPVRENGHVCGHDPQAAAEVGTDLRLAGVVVGPSVGSRDRLLVDQVSEGLVVRPLERHEAADEQRGANVGEVIAPDRS